MPIAYAWLDTSVGKPCVVFTIKKIRFCSSQYRPSISHRLSCWDYLMLQMQVTELCRQISDVFACLNKHCVQLKFQSMKHVSVTCFLLFAVKPAVGVSTGFASRISPQILEPGQPRSLSSLSTRQVSHNLLLHPAVQVRWPSNSSQ